MANYKITFSFLGQHYNGSCMQPNKITVQGSIKKAILELFNQDIKIYMCSRLDKGVHAKKMVANFKLNLGIEPNKLMNALNAKLKPNCYVYNCELVNDQFNSLIDAKGKFYRYLIHLGNDIFLNDYAYQLNYEIEVQKMLECANLFIGKHDFASFSTNELGTTIRTIDKIEITRQDKLVIIDVYGPGFLKNMVRMLVACMINYAINKININVVKIYLDRPRKGSANDLAPACGLYLMDVFY